MRAGTRVNAGQAPKTAMREPTHFMPGEASMFAVKVFLGKIGVFPGLFTGYPQSIHRVIHWWPLRPETGAAGLPEGRIGFPGPGISRARLSGGGWAAILPATPFAEQCVRQDHELSHDRDDRHFVALALFHESSVERGQRRVVSCRGHRGHIQNTPRPAPPGPHRAPARPVAAVAGVWRHAGERRRPAVPDRAGPRHPDRQRRRRDRPDAGNGAQDGVGLRHVGCGVSADFPGGHLPPFLHAPDRDPDLFPGGPVAELAEAGPQGRDGPGGPGAGARQVMGSRQDLVPGFVGGRSGKTSPNPAGTPASTLSVFAGSPVAPAKSRACRGVVRRTPGPRSASDRCIRQWNRPVASITTRPTLCCMGNFPSRTKPSLSLANRPPVAPTRMSMKRLPISNPAHTIVMSLAPILAVDTDLSEHPSRTQGQREGGSTKPAHGPGPRRGSEPRPIRSDPTWRGKDFPASLPGGAGERPVRSVARHRTCERESCPQVSTEQQLSTTPFGTVPEKNIRGRRWIGKQATRAPIHTRRGTGAGTHAGWETWQHGKPCRWRAHAKPVAREGRTGPAGWRTGRWYRGRRATPDGERGLASGECGKGAGHDHWRKPIRVRKSSETPERTACEREGRTRPPVSRAGRQGVANGLPYGSLGRGPPQRRVRRGGRGDIRAHRGVRRGAVARGTVARPQGGHLQTQGGAAGSQPEEEARPVPAVGHTLHPGSGVADTDPACAWPICGADLQPEQYAHRPGRSATDAVKRVHRLVNTGHREVVDGDLSSHFGEIPHVGPMKSVARRVSDGRMPGLVKAWLEMPTEEDDGEGGKRRTNRARRERKGTPQGAPVPPCLGNLCMRRFILGWKLPGHARRLSSEIVNYADDFRLPGKAQAAEMLPAVRQIMERPSYG